ncbi:hypothetical protein FA95DRAFT_714810 [Auriscalpium vulgare]|uniref:Uncharacterized protein n=1 Tax=Auriscalpium vulgare TaxID=40419 RepID=A0ACB8RAX5_9AGAM|nr:hypothetical protein FA95DRAFT_714810 [Auriscalpium vulgare]
MDPTTDLTFADIERAARSATRVLQDRGLVCCLFGSAGSAYLAEIGRVPGDVDIIVMPGDYQDAESIKDLLVGADARFFLLASRRRDATHRVLWFRLPGYMTTQRRVKVDILVPPCGDLHIPHLHEGRIVHVKGIPVLQLFGLLLLKVQGWWQHRTSNRSDFKAKQDADLSDIRALATVAELMNLHWNVEIYKWPSDFIERGEVHVNKLITRKGADGRKISGMGFRASFRALGFDA